jgi:hypothetical protein
MCSNASPDHQISALFSDAAQSDLFIEIGGKRLCDKLVKQRIVERAPPLREIGLGPFATRLLRNLITAAPTRREPQDGELVVGPD